MLCLYWKPGMKILSCRYSQKYGSILGCCAGAALLAYRLGLQGVCKYQKYWKNEFSNVVLYLYFIQVILYSTEYLGCLNNNGTWNTKTRTWRSLGNGPNDFVLFCLLFSFACNLIGRPQLLGVYKVWLMLCTENGGKVFLSDPEKERGVSLCIKVLSRGRYLSEE